jgi:hypothetical protein
MADHAHSPQAEQATAPLTPDAFLADRQKFWVSFTHFVVICSGAVIVLLVLMALFLL